MFARHALVAAGDELPNSRGTGWHIVTLRRYLKRVTWGGTRAPGRRLPLAAALCATLALAACGAGRTTPPAQAPQPTRIAATPGDTRLCSVISPAEFAHIAGMAATRVTPGVTTDSLTGLREVYCLYVDDSDPQQLFARGTINFELATDTSAASRIFQTVKASFTSVRNVPAVGDAAFAGSPGGAGTGTGLVVMRGPLLLYLSASGDASTVARIAGQLAKLVLSRVAVAGS